MRRVKRLWAVGSRSCDPERRGTRDLIWAACPGSGGQGWLGAWGGGDTTPTSYPAAALGELRRTWLNPMLRGPIRPEFWSGVVYATCVTLLGQQRGSAGVGAWCAAAEAALQWRISPTQAVGRRQCSGLGVTGSVSMRKVSAGQNKGRAWLCCAVVRSATADPRWVRRRGTGVRCSGP